MADRKNPVYLRLMIIVVALFLGLSLNMFQFRNPFRNLGMEPPKSSQPSEPTKFVAGQEPQPQGPTESQTLPSVSEQGAAPQTAPPAASGDGATPKPEPARESAQASKAGGESPADQTASPALPAPDDNAQAAALQAVQPAVETARDNGLSQPAVTSDEKKVRSAKLGRQVPADAKGGDAAAETAKAQAEAPDKAAAPAAGDHAALSSAEAVKTGDASTPAQPALTPPAATETAKEVAGREASAAAQTQPKETAKAAAKAGQSSGQSSVQAQFTAPKQSGQPSGGGEQSATPAGGKVLDVKVQDNPGEFVLTIVTDAPLERVTSFHAKAPARLAVDLWGPWQTSAGGAVTLQSGLMEKVRLGAHPDKLRVVIDYRDKDLATFSEPVIEKQPKGVVVRVPKPKTAAQ